MRRKQKESAAVVVTPSTSMLYSIDLLLAEIERRRLILVEEESGHIEIWSPNQKLPLAVRRGVFKFNSDLHRLIARCDKRVCPTPLLHKRFWRRPDGICAACKRLSRYVGASSREEKGIAS